MRQQQLDRVGASSLLLAAQDEGDSDEDAAAALLETETPPMVAVAAVFFSSPPVLLAEDIVFNVILVTLSLSLSALNSTVYGLYTSIFEILARSVCGQ